MSDPTKAEMMEALQDCGADVFDMEAACYWFANDHHGGQTSNLYSALSTSEYRPGALERGYPFGGPLDYLYETLQLAFA